ncbi:MAG: NADH-quinone oxidoreductase subunit J [Cyclobacteriaceae bacterium]
MIESVIFFVFGGLAVLATIFMMVTKNVIHGAYGLAVVLLSIAALFVLLNAEFLAVVQIFMYAGGVVVLLVFGIMLTNRSRKGAPVTEHRQVFFGVLCSAILLAIITALTWDAALIWEPQELAGNQTKKIGRLFLTDHIIAFELIAILLLAVLVGAAYLAKESSKNE